MITVNGVEIDFDITSPGDYEKHMQAREKMIVAEETAPDMPTALIGTPEYNEGYIAYLNGQLKLIGDFYDDVFGEGIGNQLMGPNPGLIKVLDTFDAVEAAIENQAIQIGTRLSQYLADTGQQNRAQRRAKK